MVEIICKPSSRVTYTTIQNWSNNVFNLVTKRARCDAEAHMEWIDGNIGSRLTMKYPAVVMVGPKASGEVLSVAYAGPGQHQDAGAKMTHAAPETTSKIVSAIQTTSLLLMGSVFWWQVLAPRDAERLSPAAGIAYLFTACTACSVLGIILTFAPVSICSVYQQPIDRLGMLSTIRGGWGLTSDKDQQIGGLLMWVPMCLIYLAAILAQFARWHSDPVAETEKSNA